MDQAECSYQIVMASEIIGVNHLEREMVGNIVRFTSKSSLSYGDVSDKLDQASYMVVSKLTAILKIANALDRSHKQKFKGVKAALRERELVITVESAENIVLEKGLLPAYAHSFEEVFSVKPAIREKKVFS